MKTFKRVVPQQVGHPNLILETLPKVCAGLNWEFKSNPKVLWGRNEWEEIFCRVHAPKFHSTFNLQQMPGCCAVLIASFIDPDPRTPENFQEVLDVIEGASYEAGFGSVLMAQVVYEDAIWPVCLKNKWVMSDKFINAKSGNKVVYLMKDLGQYGKRHGFEVKV